MAVLDSVTIDNLLKTHDLQTTTPDCAKTLGENRFRDANSNYYCWKGIIQQQNDKGEPECVIGVNCSPYSYTEARTAFCLTWKCDSPFRYVAPLPTDADKQVINDRGGIVIDADPKNCKVLDIHCVLDGVRQSFDNAMSSANSNDTLIHMAVLFSLMVGGAYAYRVYGNKLKFKTPKIFH